MGVQRGDAGWGWGGRRRRRRDLVLAIHVDSFLVPVHSARKETISALARSASRDSNESGTSGLALPPGLRALE